jgi:hypothetical protein
MSIYKHEHTDGSGNWFLWLFAYLFGLGCPSHISEWTNGPLQCRLLRWHHGRHHDTVSDTNWAYGDESFEG